MRRRITQSSLPDSLIPHLYSSPQQCRTSLNDDLNSNDLDDLSLNPDVPTGSSSAPRPIYSDPRFYSSNARLPPITRRGSSLPAAPRSTPPSPHLILPPAPRPRPQPPTPPRQQQQHQHQHQQHQRQPLQHDHQQVYHDRPLPPPRTFLHSHEDSYTSSLASLSISAPITASSSSPPFHRFPDSPESHPPKDSQSPGTPTNNPRDGSRKGKKRKYTPDPEETNRKSRNPRKTLVACNFCRGRKLRCNGGRPACYNCSIRNAKRCEYVPVQRRRGPGRAPRGSRTRRSCLASSTRTGGGGASRSGPVSSPNGSANIPYELELLAPEVRPYTSVMTFDPPSTVFTFRPPTPVRPRPAPAPQAGPSRQTLQHSQNHFTFSSAVHPMQQQQQRQPQPLPHHHHYQNDDYQHSRPHRSRETSSEDLEDVSDIEEFYRGSNRRRYGS